jgi:streptogramin lyase
VIRARGAIPKAATLLAVCGVVVIGVVAGLDAVRGDTEPAGGEAAPATGANPAAAAAPRPARLEIAASIPVERPAGVAVAAESVWVASSIAGELVRLDVGQNAVAATIPLEGRPGYVVAGQGGVYVFDELREEAIHVDPATNAVTDRLPVGNSALGLAFADGDAWIPDAAGSAVARVDPSGAVAAQVVVPGPTAVAAGAGAVWAVSPRTRTVSRIDPASNLVFATIPLEDIPAELAVADGAVWVSHPATKTISRIDPRTNEVVARIRLGVGAEPLLIAAGADGLWVLSITHVVRISPRTNRVVAETPIELTRHPGPEPLVLGGIAVGEGAAWVADTYGGRILRIQPAG